MQRSERHPVLTPALEGSKSVVPSNAQLPMNFRSATRMGDMGSPFQGYYDRGFYPRHLPPIQPGYMLPPEGYQVPSLMMRPRMRYTGPPSLLPMWGGYSMQGNYFPERRPMNMLPPPRQISQPVIHQPPHPPKKTSHSNRPSSMFLFGIILKEIVAALHRIYLNPSGNIYPVLCDVIGPNCYDLSQLVHGGQMGEREESVLIQELQYVIENLIYHITEIMPSTGVLGTHRKSAVFELIRSGKRFPDGYFWQVEMERLQFGEGGRTMNVGDTEGFLLLLGIFISRSLVTTVLMKPIDYGLSSQALSEIAERNLRIVASTLLFLVRRIAVSRQRGIMGIPQEIAKYLYDDEEMKHVYSRLSRTFNYSEGLLREWGTEYIRRLRASSLQNS